MKPLTGEDRRVVVHYLARAFAKAASLRRAARQIGPSGPTETVTAGVQDDGSEGSRLSVPSRHSSDGSR